MIVLQFIFGQLDLVFCLEFVVKLGHGRGFLVELAGKRLSLIQTSAACEERLPRLHGGVIQGWLGGEANPTV